MRMRDCIAQLSNGIPSKDDIVSSLELSGYDVKL
jgi:hypothetical protein